MAIKRAYMAVIVLVALMGCGASNQSAVDPAKLKELRGGETRQTLSPAYFTGRTALAYQAAREIPEVLDSMHCYCECKLHFGHKSLLSCYVDQHALHCDVCIEEAVMAYEMHKQGKDIMTIRKAVDEKFSGGH